MVSGLEDKRIRLENGPGQMGTSGVMKIGELVGQEETGMFCAFTTTLNGVATPTPLLTPHGFCASILFIKEIIYLPNKLNIEYVIIKLQGVPETRQKSLKSRENKRC